MLHLGLAQVSFGQDLVQDGDFEDLSTTPTNKYGGGLSNTAGTGGEAGDLAVLADWSSPDSYYNFLFTGGNAGDQTVTGTGGDLSLWGPNSGSNNGLALPTGYTGNVVGADGAYEVGPISQVIGGLTIGHNYMVTFDWAAAQQSGYNSATTDNWTVGLGAAGLTTAASLVTSAGGQATTTVNLASKGFSGWMTAAFTFTATSTSETLYFIATGTPDGEPPFALLADVSMVAVPEPITTSSWILLFGMLIMFGKRAWQRYQKKPLATA